MTTSVFCEFRFEAAHHLPKAPEGHKCRRPHGHSYRVIVTVTGCVGDRGWIVDYAEIEAVWRKEVFDRLDHQVLNEVMPAGYETTSEHLAQWIAETMNLGLRAAPCNVTSVDVWETASFGARCEL